MNSLIIFCFLFIFLIAILTYAFKNEIDLKEREISLLKKQIQNRNDFIDKQSVKIKNINIKKTLVDKYDLIKELVDKVD